jgi:hypothetical protein
MVILQPKLQKSLQNQRLFATFATQSKRSVTARIARAVIAHTSIPSLRAPITIACYDTQHHHTTPAIAAYVIGRSHQAAESNGMTDVERCIDPLERRVVHHISLCACRPEHASRLV